MDDGYSQIGCSRKINCLDCKDLCTFVLHLVADQMILYSVGCYRVQQEDFTQEEQIKL